MKLRFLPLLLLFINTVALGQNNAPDSGKTEKTFYAIEQAPAFPGGNDHFLQYLELAVRPTDVAKLLGIDGKVRVSFTVSKSGAIINAKALDTIGYGCEREAVRVILSAPRWRPGIQNGRPVDVNFDVAVTFSVVKEKISFKELNKSEYGFIFNINGMLVNIKDAEAKLGASFPSGIIETALPYKDVNNRLLLADKKEIYMIRIKST